MKIVSKQIKLYDKEGNTLEHCQIDNFSLSYDEVDDFVKSKNSCDDELLLKAREYQERLLELAKTKASIAKNKYAKDNLLCRIIELSKPPFFIKESMLNYKVLVLYFLRHFKRNTILKSSTLKSDSGVLSRELFKQQEKLMIYHDISSFFHLINIKKNLVESQNVYEKMIYDTLNFGDFGGDKRFFKTKVATLGWIKGTLSNPDYIYSKETIIAQQLKFDFAFVRQTGSGTKSQKFMYHLVGIKHLNTVGNLARYAIVSQFPIEIDREYSDENMKISRLHHYVQCTKPLYRREGKEIPVYSKTLVTNDSSAVNRLKNMFER